MPHYLLVGNIFALLAAICIAISVIKKNKTDLIWWQIFDVTFCILSNIALYTYAALTTNSIALLRNVLAYKNKLTPKLTFILFILCVIAGLWANNRGIIGFFPVIASGSYTIFMYTTKNDQQMRWALISNLLLWLIHDVYVQAYPLAITDLVLSIWTALQIFKNKNNKRDKMHTLNVQEKYYNMLKSGAKTIELRLFDEKRQAIKVGEIIEFTNHDNVNDKFSAKVINLYKAGDFRSLCQKIDCDQAGFQTNEELIKRLEEFYTPQKQKQFGVLGIEIKKIQI